MIASVPGYRALALIGRGGQGTVYRAVQESTGRTVALKVIHRHDVSGAAFERFKRERDLICLLRHPHVVAVLDAGVVDERQYLAMELVDGPTLEEWLQDPAERTREELVRLFLPLCDAVAHAHRQGVTHRDLKPQNVLMQRMEDPTAPWAPKIVDFGLARVLDGIDPHFATARDQDRMSTLAYSAPELLSDGVAVPDTRIDVFGLGALLYRMLAGVAPRDGLTLEEVRATNGPASYRSIARRQLSRRPVGRDLQAIVFQALAPSPDERYSTVQDLAADLHNFLDGRPVNAIPRQWRYVLGKSLLRHRAAWTLGAAAVLAAAGGLTAWAVQAEHTRQQSIRVSRAFTDHAREVDALVIEMIAPVQKALGTDTAALAAVQRLVESREHMIREDPQNRDLLSGLVDLRRTHGDLLLSAGHSQAARAEFEAALAILAANFDLREDPLRDADASVLRVRIADAIKPMDQQEALRRYELILVEDRARLAANVQHPHAARFADDLAWSLDRVAGLQWVLSNLDRIVDDASARQSIVARFTALAEECSALQSHLRDDPWRAADVALAETNIRQHLLRASGVHDEDMAFLHLQLSSLAEAARSGSEPSWRYDLMRLSALHPVVVNALFAREPGAVTQAQSLLKEYDELHARTGLREVLVHKSAVLLPFARLARHLPEAAATRRGWLEEALAVTGEHEQLVMLGINPVHNEALIRAQLAFELGSLDSARAVALLTQVRERMTAGCTTEAQFAHTTWLIRDLLEFGEALEHRSEEYLEAVRAFEYFLESGILNEIR